jgi:hypothetical protein
MTASHSLTTDPWASTDHDPTSYPAATTVVCPPSPSASHALAMARDDIHNALTADDDHRCRTYALAARDTAGQVLTDPNSTPAERESAGYYFADAEAIVAQTGGDPDA